jgi:deoxycytidylate deaminase
MQLTLLDLISYKLCASIDATLELETLSIDDEIICTPHGCTACSRSIVDTMSGGYSARGILK